MPVVLVHQGPTLTQESYEKIVRKLGVAEATFYNWRKKYGGLMPSEMRRLKQLEEGWRHCLRPAS